MKKNINKKPIKTRYEIKEDAKYFVKNRLPAFVLAFLIIFWTIASIFGFIAYFRTKDESVNTNMIYASAEGSDFQNSNFDIPLTNFIGFQNDNVIMDNTMYLLIRGRTVHFLSSWEYGGYLDGSETLDGTAITLDNGGIGYPKFETQPAFNTTNDDTGFSYEVYALSGFRPATSIVYDYFSPYSLSTILYYDIGNPTIRFDMTLRCAYYSIRGNAYEVGAIQGFTDFTFRLEIDAQMFYHDTAIISLPYLGFYYDSGTVIDDIPLRTIMLDKIYEPYARFYYMTGITERDLEDWRDSANYFRQLYEEMSIENAELEELIAEYELRIQNLTTALSQANADIGALSTEVSSLRSQIATLEQRITQAYADGKAAGDTIGYNRGFTDGVASANEYSFTGLLSAVFDVPVRTFTSLFNFDVLGVNLANFFLSLLTCAVVIMIIRWII